jgi:hypothetical protein
MNTDTQPETLPTPDDQNYVSAHQDTLQDKLEKLERLEELAELFFKAKRQHHYHPTAPRFPDAANFQRRDQLCDVSTAAHMML